MKPTDTLYINGKFLVQRMTGVQRFAHGLVAGLDDILVRNQDLSPPVLLVPPGANRLPLVRIEQRECGIASIPPTIWEQSCLPWAARDGALLCLAGSAPFGGRLVIPTIHDAAVYNFPEAYSWKFVLWYRSLFYISSSASPINFTVSHSSALDLERYLPGRQFRVIPNAAEHILYCEADMSVFERSGLEPGRFLIAVASQNLTKNLGFLVEAYARADLYPDVKLVFVGGKNTRVFSNCSSYNAVHGVVSLGEVSDEELRALYQSALALVFPSVYEGFGIPPLEAMSCGCPVLASNSSSIPEVCGDAAYYFDPYNFDSLIEALRTIVVSANLRADLIAKGHSRRLVYSWRRSSESLLSELQSIGLMKRGS